MATSAEHKRSQQMGATLRAAASGPAAPAALPAVERPDYEPPRVPGWKPWAGEFLKNLAETGNVRGSCYRAGVTERPVYRLRKEDPIFREEWKKALGVATFVAEQTYRVRALEGWTEVTVKRGRDGEIIETQERTKFSPGMLTNYLAVQDPDRWGKKSSVEVNRNDTISVKGVQEMLRDPRIAALVCELDEAMAAPVTVVEALPSPVANTCRGVNAAPPESETEDAADEG